MSVKLPYFALILLTLGSAAPVAHADGPLRESLRGYFEALSAGAPPMTAAARLHEPALLAALYEGRDYQPLWIAGGPLAAQIPALLAAIDDSLAHGLNAGHYHRRHLETLHHGNSDPLTLELLASDAYLRQVRHRSSGVIQPRQIDQEWHLLRPEAPPVATLERTAAVAAEPGAAGDAPSPGVQASLDALWPDNAEYRELVAARARYLALGDVTMVRVSDGPLLRSGERGPRVLQLKERLLGPGEYDDRFDTTLREAVVAQQRSAGLNPDGIVGEATLEILNAGRSSWIDRIDANLERWRWLPVDLPDTYLRVNIASFVLRVVHQGEDALRMDVIVGRPYRRTPVFSESIKHLVFNPYWYVPHQIAVQDKLPALRSDPAQLAQQGFEVRPAAEDGFQPITAVDFSQVERHRFPFALRQRPGPANALGQVKFMLPNPFNVYLHDTPGRDLFAQAERSFSSGCVRLSRPLELADWVLRNDGQSDAAAAIPDLIQRAATQTVYLRKPLPTYVVYFTAFTDDRGEVVFRRDLYRRDPAIVAGLRAGEPATVLGSVAEPSALPAAGPAG